MPHNPEAAGVRFRLSLNRAASKTSQDRVVETDAYMPASGIIQSHSNTSPSSAQETSHSLTSATSGTTARVNALETLPELPGTQPAPPAASTVLPLVPFHGRSVSEYKSFISGCETLFETKPAMFQFDEVKVLHALDLLEDDAWALCSQHDKLSVRGMSWSVFKEFLFTNLRPQALRTAKAERKWRQAQQANNQTVKAYVKALQVLEKDTESHTDKERYDQLLYSLKPEITDAIVVHPDGPKAYADLISLAIAKETKIKQPVQTSHNTRQHDTTVPENPSLTAAERFFGLHYSEARDAYNQLKHDMKMYLVSEALFVLTCDDNDHDWIRVLDHAEKHPSMKSSEQRFKADRNNARRYLSKICQMICVTQRIRLRTKVQSPLPSASSSNQLRKRKTSGEQDQLLARKSARKPSC